VIPCEWTIKKGKCGAPAAWQHATIQRGVMRIWSLCEHHKSILLESYNEKTRAKEEPEWTRIKYEIPDKSNR